MILATAPRVAWRCGLLVLPLLGLPGLAFGLAVLNGVRAELPTEDPALADVAAALLLGLAASGFVAIEILAYGLGRLLVLRAASLAQVAAAGVARDFRHAPMSTGADEFDRLATAFGRTVRHLARRRRELDWMAGAVAREAPLPDAADRTRALLAPLTNTAQFAADDAEPADVWLHAPRHRLVCALAGGVVVLTAAPVAPAWWAAIAAAALLGGRFTERLRGPGAPLVLLVVLAALANLLLTEPVGPGALAAAVLVAFAAGVAVHGGGGWRGPAGGLADTAWLRGGLAGAVAGSAAAVALCGVVGAAVANAVVMPFLLAALGLAAASLAPPVAVATPADWLGFQATVRLLRRTPVRRQLLGGALPGGLALGAAIALAAGGPECAVAGALVASGLLALPALGLATAVRPTRLPAAGLLAAAGLLVGGLDTTVAGAALASAGAALAWPLAIGGVASSAIPRQVAILAAFLRSLGVVLALAIAPLLPSGIPAALAALALLAGVLPARRG